MTCLEAIDSIPLYLTGDLTAESALLRDFTRHLQACPACARDAERQAGEDARLRAAILDQPLDTSAMESLVASQIKSETAARNKRRMLRWSAAAAAVFVVSFLGYRVGYRVAYRVVTPSPTAGDFAAAARDHRTEIVDRQPRRWKTDVTSVSELAAREGISNSAIAAIAPPEFHFEQAKLCRLDGRLYLHLVYADSTGQRNFSVFLDGKTPDSGDRKIYTSSVGQEHVAGFSGAQLKAMVVTDQPSEAAVQFARQAAALI